MVEPTTAARAAAALLNPENRRSVGKVLLAVLSPIVALIALLCCLAGGAANQNNAVADLCFWGGEMPDDTDAAFRQHIIDMRQSLSALDSAAAEVDADLDVLRIQAAFFVLCFGSDGLPIGNEEAAAFVSRFVRYVEIESEEGVQIIAVPLLPEEAYASLTAMGCDMSEDTIANIDAVYARYKEDDI